MEPTLAPLDFETAGFETFSSLFNAYQKALTLILTNILFVLVFIILKILNLLVKSKLSWFGP